MARKNRRTTSAGRHRRLKSLPFIDEVEDRIKRGDVLQDVATFIQEEHMCMTDIGARSLAAQLSRYKKDMESPAAMLGRHVPQAVKEALKEVEEGLDEMKALHRLYQVQLERVLLGHEVEAANQKLSAGVNDAVRIAADVLARHHTIKMELGLGPEGGANLGTINVRAEVMQAAKAKYGEDVFRALMDPVTRGKILGIMTRLVSAQSRDADADHPEQ